MSLDKARQDYDDGQEPTKTVNAKLKLADQIQIGSKGLFTFHLWFHGIFQVLFFVGDTKAKHTHEKSNPYDELPGGDDSS